MEEADTTDGEHMYEDVYNMNHRQAKADKHSGGTHTYYNEIVPTAKVKEADTTDGEHMYEALTYI